MIRTYAADMHLNTRIASCGRYVLKYFPWYPDQFQLGHHVQKVKFAKSESNGLAFFSGLAVATPRGTLVLIRYPKGKSWRRPAWW